MWLLIIPVLNSKRNSYPTLKYKEFSSYQSYGIVAGVTSIRFIRSWCWLWWCFLWIVRFFLRIIISISRLVRSRIVGVVRIFGLRDRIPWTPCGRIRCRFRSREVVCPSRIVFGSVIMPSVRVIRFVRIIRLLGIAWSDWIISRIFARLTRVWSVARLIVCMASVMMVVVMFMVGPFSGRSCGGSRCGSCRCFCRSVVWYSSPRSLFFRS